MKCICGYEEPEFREEDVPIYFQSGKRKGELKRVDKVFHYPKPEEKFIKIYLEKGFSFQVMEESYFTDYYSEVELYACPKCKTVRMNG